MTQRAVIYTRISKDREGRELGVARQEADCRELAEREGLAVVGVYSDNDVSASTNSRTPRPNYLLMLDDAEAGRFDVVVAYSTSRLTRKPREQEDLLELHEEAGTRFLTVAGGWLDLASSTGRTLTRIIGSVDAGEAERTAELVRRKQRELAEAGRHNGPRPYGWTIHGKGADQRLVLEPVEAAVIRECIDRVLAGEAIWKITKDLNARSVPTTTGKPWVTQVLRRTLLNDRNRGVRKHQPRGKDGKAKGKPAYYTGQWEPIIDTETHERLVAHLTDPARRSNNRGTEPKYLLTSLAYCGACGGHVVGTNEFRYVLKNGRERFYPHSYRCPRSGCHKVNRRMAEVDALVSGIVVGVLERDGVRLLGGDPAVVETASRRIAELEDKLAVTADRFAEDEITAEQLSRINQRLRPQLADEHRRLAEARPLTGLNDFASAGVAEAWANAGVEARKGILRLLGVRIVIEPIGSGNGRLFDPSSITITWPTG